MICRCFDRPFHSVYVIPGQNVTNYVTNPFRLIFHFYGSFLKKREENYFNGIPTDIEAFILQHRNLFVLLMDHTNVFVYLDLFFVSFPTIHWLLMKFCVFNLSCRFKWLFAVGKRIFTISSKITHFPNRPSSYVCHNISTLLFRFTVIVVYVYFSFVVYVFVAFWNVNTFRFSFW